MIAERMSDSSIMYPFRIYIIDGSPIRNGVSRIIVEQYKTLHNAVEIVDTDMVLLKPKENNEADSIR